MLSGARDHIDHALAPVRGGRDVEEHELVRALVVVGDRLLDRIASVAQFEELRALDDAPVGHVEAWDDSFAQHW